MLQRGKKGPKGGVQNARNLPTWKIGLEKDIQLETRRQITKPKKNANALQIQNLYMSLG